MTTNQTHSTVKLMDNTKVIKTKLIGTNRVVFSAWEPTEFAVGHSVVTTIEGKWYGRIGSRRLPEELESLPAMSASRSKAVRAWHQSEYQRAYAIIEEYDPRATCGRRDMGEIEITLDSPIGRGS